MLVGFSSAKPSVNQAETFRGQDTPRAINLRNGFNYSYDVCHSSAEAIRRTPEFNWQSSAVNLWLLVSAFSADCVRLLYWAIVFLTSLLLSPESSLQFSFLFLRSYIISVRPARGGQGCNTGGNFHIPLTVLYMWLFSAKRISPGTMRQGSTIITHRFLLSIQM